MTQKICHRLVAETAKDIARNVYEALAVNNTFFRTYPTMQVFVNQHWSEFIGDARKCLTVMLRPKSDSDPSNPEFYFSEHIRDEIFEALCLEGEMKSAPELRPSGVSLH